MGVVFCFVELERVCAVEVRICETNPFGMEMGQLDGGVGDDWLGDQHKG